MNFISKLYKLVNLASHPKFVSAALSHRVAAATEHLDVIKYTKAKTLIDVGANKGQFSLAFRVLRPDSQIYAFEPLARAADTFESLFYGDRRCTLRRVALADKSGDALFHVTDRQDSSSLLKPGDNQRLAFGVSEAHRTIIPVRTLGECLSSDEIDYPSLLKIDVQGAELSVIRGCDFLEKVDFIYAELSFIELYEDQPLFSQIVRELSDIGFSVRGIYNPVVSDHFSATQADVLFSKFS